MKNHPEGETRKERRLQRIVGAGVVIIFLLLGTIVIQGVQSYQSQVNHHAASIRDDKKITQLLQTVHDAQMTNEGRILSTQNLEKQVATVINGLPAADSELGQFAAYSIAVNEVICADVATVAKASGIRLVACPTVPNFAPIK